MQDHEYSFLDLTVMPFLRRQVISPDAAVLFDRDFKRVLWANAIGTNLFGGNAVGDLIEMELPADNQITRQFRNAASQLGGDTTVVRKFRIGRGLRSEAVHGTLSTAELPDGSECVLLICNELPGRDRYREHELAELAVDSLDGFADAAAIVDEYGLPIASTDDFDSMGVDADELLRLVNIAAKEDDRLVKRPLKSERGSVIAAGIGRIRDIPGRYLIVLADADTGFEETDEAEEEISEPEQEAASDEIIDEENHFLPLDEIAGTLAANDQADGEEPDLPPSSRELPEIEEAIEPATIVSVEDEDSGNESEGTSLVDRWYFWADDKPQGEDDSESEFDEDELTGEDTEPVSEDADETRIEPLDTPEVISAEITEPPAEEPAKQAALPSQTTGKVSSEAVRFAFSIDEDGIFRSVSPELGETVGKGAADITGKSWDEVARSLGFDESGTISALLKKADTWSGRAVLWPVEDSDMAMPVDLAALPVFDRDRKFDGFKGFGIIRTADAMIDPDSRGTRLGSLLEEAAKQAALETGSGFEPSATADTPDDGLISVDKGTEDVPLTPGWQDDDESNKPLIDPDKVTVSSNGNKISAKIVRLETRRNPEKSENENSDGLSRREAEAFHEIGRSLDNGDEANQGDEDGKVAREFQKAEAASVFGKRETPPEPENSGILVTASPTMPENPLNLTAEENRQLLEELPVPVLVYRAGHVLFANQALLEETGYSSIHELAEVGGIDALLSSQLDPEKGVAPTINLIRRDGSRRPITPNLKSIHWQAGKALCLTFQTGEEDASVHADAGSDVSKSLDMIRVSELQSILETAADGIIITDGSGRIETINASGEALFGIRNADMIGNPLTSLFAQESHKPVEEYVEAISSDSMARLMNDGREVIGIEASGGFIPLFLTIGRVGSNGRLCAILRDLTEWKRTSDELLEARRKAEQANEQKSEFLSRVSHEIREPLTTIIGFSDVMIEERFGAVGNPRYKEYLADINRSGVHVLDLVNDLLDISRIESGKMEMTYEAVDLNRVAAETVALLQPQANSKRVIVRTSFSRAVPKIVADLRSLRQIIVNLLSNAIRYSPPNSQIIVSTTFETNGEVALRVRDTGPGMSAEELAKALEPFGRVEKPDELTKGTGLGLPLTKALVEANRAYFELESEEGEGTIAHVQFPAQRVLAD